MKYLKYIATSLLLVSMVSCDTLTGGPDLPIPLDETMENTGAFLRVLSVESPAFDVANLEGAEYAFVGELQDKDEGKLVDEVNFYVGYLSNDRSIEIDELTDPIATIDASALNVSEESGLPRGRFSILLTDIIDAMPIEMGDLSLGDRFDIRWEIVMNDGRTFTNTDISSSITGGFYRSPFFARSNVVLSIPEDVFVGSYTFTQDNASGTFDPIFENNTTFTVDVKVDPNNTLNGRVINVTYLSQFGGWDQELTLNFTRFQGFLDFEASDNYLTVPGYFAFGVGCGGPGLGFDPDTDSNNSSFDVDDDSQFTFAVIDNPLGGCGGAPTPVTFTATKN